jgi:hypothetical protein
MDQRRKPRRKSRPRIGAPRRLARRAAERQRVAQGWAHLITEVNAKLRPLVKSQLEELRKAGENDTDFALSLGVSRETLATWLNRPKLLPQIDGLVALGEVHGPASELSLDWLVGRPVSRRWTDHAPAGNLAAALVRHVLIDYARQYKPHRSLDGIARVVHGKWQLQRHRSIDEAEADVNSPADFAGTDAAIDSSDPEAFLRDVCEWAYERAEEFERTTFSKPPEAMMKEIYRAVAQADVLSEAAQDSGKRTRDALRALAIAALDPRAAASRKAVRFWTAHIRQSRRSLRHK